MEDPNPEGGSVHFDSENMFSVQMSAMEILRDCGISLHEIRLGSLVHIFSLLQPMHSTVFFTRYFIL